MGLFQKCVGFGFLLFWVGIGFARAESSDCSGNGPLVVEEPGSGVSVGSSTNLGEWRLPISSLNPDMMTEARVRLEIVGTSLLMHFSFPDQYPWGLPFSFEKAEFRWESQGRLYLAQVDWSQDCSGPGRSLYPHQAWTASLDLGSDTQNLHMEKPEFRLWGSRN
jgi:hypothetical protein